LASQAFLEDGSKIGFLLYLSKETSFFSNISLKRSFREEMERISG
jgi:hypothetical protein